MSFDARSKDHTHTQDIMKITKQWTINWYKVKWKLCNEKWNLIKEEEKPKNKEEMEKREQINRIINLPRNTSATLDNLLQNKLI